MSVARETGVSLVELMVGLAVVGLLVTIGFPSYTAWINNSYTRNAADSIQNGLQLARSEAIRRNQLVQFVLSANGGWTVQVAPPFGGGAAQVIETRSAQEGVKNVAMDVRLADGDAGADPSLTTFDGMGRRWADPANNPVNPPPDGSAQIAQVDVESTMLTGSDKRQLRVLVGAAGGIRMCDRNTNLPSDDPRRC